jgi:hypothetical protein
MGQLCGSAQARTMEAADSTTSTVSAAPPRLAGNSVRRHRDGESSGSLRAFKPAHSRGDGRPVRFDGVPGRRGRPSRQWCQVDESRHRAGLEQEHRVDIGVPDPSAEMQAGGRRARVSRAGLADRLLPGHHVTLAHGDARQPRVRRADAVIVIDGDEQASAHPAGERHDPVLGGHDLGAEGSADVDPSVTRPVRVWRRFEAPDHRPHDGPRVGPVAGLDATLREGSGADP